MGDIDTFGEFRGVAHFKELDSGKIKVFVPDNIIGGGNKFTTKTFNNSSKKEIEDFFDTRIRKSRGGNAKSLTKKDKAFLYGRWLPVDKEKHTSISEEVLSERKKQRELRQKRTEERNKRLEKIKKKSLVFLKQKKDKEKIEKEKDMKDDTVWESLVRLHNRPR